MDEEPRKPESASLSFEDAAQPAAPEPPTVPFTLHLNANVAAWFNSLPDGQREARDLLEFYMETNRMEPPDVQPEAAPELQL